MRSCLLLASLLVACGGDDRSSGPDGSVAAPDAAPPDDPDAATPDAAPPDEPDAAAPDATPSPDAPPDPVIPPLERAHAGGKPGAIRIVGDRAYLGVGPRLAIWDLAPTPVLVGESEPLPGIIESVDVAGDRAFVTAWNVYDGAVHVIDVADPAHPEETTSIRLASGIYSHPIALARAGARLFVADYHEGVFELDVTDPDAPVVVGHLATHVPQRLEIVGDRLYLSGTNFFDGVWLAALDISAGMTDLGVIDWVSGAAMVAVTPAHRAVWVGDGTRVVDVSDPDAPVELYADAAMRSGNVVVDGGTAWIATLAGLEVLDVSTPEVAHAATVAVPPAVAGVGARAGDHLALIDDRGDLLALDAGEPLAPVLDSTTRITLCSPCIDVGVDGDVLVTATTGTGALGGITTARVTDLALLGASATLVQADLEQIDVRDGHAYAADWFFGLRVFDVSDPASPVLVGQADTAGYPSAVALAADRAYLAESTNGGWLRAIDISNPAQPVELGSIQTSRASDVAVVGHHALVADATLYAPGGLRVFDASDPAHLALVAEYDACGPDRDPTSVAVTGTTAILACGTSVEIVDVSDPAAPAHASSWPVPNPWGTRVAARGDRAYVGHATGVIALDISDPTAPAFVDERTTAWQVRGIVVPYPGRVVVATQLGGVYQFEL